MSIGYSLAIARNWQISALEEAAVPWLPLTHLCLHAMLQCKWYTYVQCWLGGIA
jgi:hypothetical protein